MTTTMHLADAMEAGREDPETPIRISAGRCEAKVGGVQCGSAARWWRWHQFRCSQHKETRA